ncbi:tRNA-guanine transglycosylase, partial [bacterium]|nr:tRNA-guanine transglycosylase [bacterium]
ISKSRYMDKFKPIEKGCKCFTCQNYSIAQLNFLFKAKEQLAGRLLTIHNLWFLENKLKEIREKIDQNKF